MLPIKYSFKFLKRKEAKQIRADFLSNKKRYIRHLVIREIEDTEAVEIFNQPEIIFNEAVPVKEGYRKRAFLKLAGVVGLGAIRTRASGSTASARAASRRPSCWRA